MIDLASLRQRIASTRAVLHPDAQPRAQVAVMAEELEQLLAVYEAACAWRDEGSDRARVPLGVALVDVIDAARNPSEVGT